MSFLLKSHEMEMVLEDERLDELDNTTKIWWQEMNSKSNIWPAYRDYCSNIF